MSGGFEPSPDFVERIMSQVRACEAGRVTFAERIAFLRPFRYAIACGGTFIGVFGAVPVF